MVSRKCSPFIAAVAGAAIFAVTGYAQAFGGHGGHGGHHGSSALAACLAAAPKSVKTGLRSTFKSSSSRSDEEAVHAAKQNLAQAILAQTTPLTPYENALSAAQLKVIQDEDAIAQNVCGQLSTSQLAAASTLYTNLQSNRQTVRGYFQTAHAAAGQGQ
jgi:hypothetical protein